MFSEELSVLTRISSLKLQSEPLILCVCVCVLSSYEGFFYAYLSFASVRQTRLGERLVEMVLCVLQWSWPWSWTACTAAFATLASTQTLSWSTPRERGGSPSLISRATLLLSVLALYSCSMEKSINGWVERKETSVFFVLPSRPPSFFICHPHVSLPVVFLSNFPHLCPISEFC